MGEILSISWLTSRNAVLCAYASISVVVLPALIVSHCTRSADGCELSLTLRLGLWPVEEEKMVLMK